jgi:hypothetical protein
VGVGGVAQSRFPSSLTQRLIRLHLERILKKGADCHERSDT